MGDRAWRCCFQYRLYAMLDEMGSCISYLFNYKICAHVRSILPPFHACPAQAQAMATGIVTHPSHADDMRLQAPCNCSILYSLRHIPPPIPIAIYHWDAYPACLSLSSHISTAYTPFTYLSLLFFSAFLTKRHWISSSILLFRTVCHFDFNWWLQWSLQSPQPAPPLAVPHAMLLFQLTF